MLNDFPPVGASIEIVHGDNVVPGVEEVGEAHCGTQSGGERHGVLGIVQGSQAGLQDVPRWIAASSILESEISIRKHG